VPNDPDRITAAVADLMASWQAGKLSERFDLSRSGEFSWSSCATAMLSILLGSQEFATS
jgi:hypothetical protein